MCTTILVCHGDKTKTLEDTYNDEQRTLAGEGDCKPATFYITADGKYAVDADFVSVSDMNDPNFDVTSVPSIKLR